MEIAKTAIKSGWGQADITPYENNVLIAGQFHARVSEGVLDPVTATALAFESANRDGQPEHSVMVSCDLVTISDELRDSVRDIIKKRVPELRTDKIFIGATHTHTAPDVRVTPYGMEKCADEYKASLKTSNDNSCDEKHNMWPYLKLDVMYPADYLKFASEKIAGAIKEAWEKREKTGISYGIGHAVVGHNRRLTYKDGTSRMYASAQTDEFSHVEGYEDHSVYALMTYNADKKLTGIVVNIPCPSQVSENLYLISADYWHETREELRKRFGQEIYILAQCAPAGDQSPHLLLGKKAEERMWRLKGMGSEQNPPRREIALKISNAITDLEPYAKKEIDWTPALVHKCETLDLPRRIISEKDVREALEEAETFREEYEKLADELQKTPEIRNKPRWYTEITKAYRRMERGRRVKKRFELQKANPNMQIEVHAVRIGETAFATNPFELYLDYGVRMRELSKATQTFLIQKAGCSGTYLPSERSIACGGYGSVPGSTDIGHEGGDKLVEWTTKTINDMFAE